MPSKRKVKTVPCEGCRERKKKCSAGQPCERCKRLGIQCYYLEAVTPPKVECIEVVNSQEIQLRVQVMEDIMRTMEQEMHLLQATIVNKQNDLLVASVYSDSSFLVNKNQLLSEPNDNVTAKWELEFGKDGGFSINTDIQSYTSLLNHIKAFSANPTFFPIIKQPNLASLSAGGGFLHRNMLASVLRKGNFKITIASIQNTQRKQPTLLIEPPPALMQQKNLSLRLVNTYFSCRFLDRVIFHQATFYDMFVNGYTDTESSPVVCALSAAVLTMRCKHVMDIVPYAQQMQLGEYFFNKARQIVSLNFDEVTMETMIVYLHLAIYKSNLLRPHEANVYLDIAIRIRQILAEDTYKNPPPVFTLSRYAREYETFIRLHAGFYDVVRFNQFINNERGVPVKTKKNSPHHQEMPFEKTFQSICVEKYNPNPLPNESQQTARAIMKEKYINYISDTVGPYFRRVRFSQDDLVPLSFLMKTEQDLYHVYNHKISFDYRLSQSIFEDGLSDIEFKARLEQDNRCDTASVLIASRYHQSILALHEPFLPVIRRPPVLAELSMLQENDNSSPQKKRKRKPKRHNSSCDASTVSTNTIHSSSDDTDNCYEDPDVLSIYSIRAQEICHKNAIIVVRLLEYQCMTLGSCTIPVASLLCAWDILVRDSCLGMTLSDLEHSGVSNYLTPNDIRLAREYAVRCIEVLRRGYVYNGAEREIWEYYERIEAQLLKALCFDASPTAKYWEPVSTWY